MEPKKINLTDEEIREEFSDVIEAVKLDEIYKLERYIINAIKVILEAGVNREDHDSILEVIMKIDSRRNDGTEITPTTPHSKSSNQKLIEEIIEEKPYFNENENPYSNIEDLIKDTEKVSSRR